MKRTVTTVAVTAVLALAVVAMVDYEGHTYAQDGSREYQIDPPHASVAFRIQHASAGYVYGLFGQTSGSFTLGSNPSFDVTIQADSIETANEKRDQHLRSPDFFNVRQFPQITFRSTDVSRVDEDTLNVTGDLTLLGTTKSVTIPVDIVATDAAFQGSTRGSVHAEFDIDRSDWGMSWGVDNGVLSDKVTLMVGLEGIEQ